MMNLSNYNCAHSNNCFRCNYELILDENEDYLVCPNCKFAVYPCWEDTEYYTPINDEWKKNPTFKE